MNLVIIIFLQVQGFQVIKINEASRLQRGFYYPPTSRYVLVAPSMLKVVSEESIPPVTKKEQKQEISKTEKILDTTHIPVPQPSPKVETVKVALNKVIYDTLYKVDTVKLFTPLVIPFAEGTSQISQYVIPVLDDFVRELSRVRDRIYLVVEGNSGPSGLAAYNRQLAELRANEVASYFEKRGFKTEIKIANRGPFVKVYVKYR